MKRGILIASLLVFFSGSSNAAEDAREIDLRPREKAEWNIRNVWAWVSAPIAYAYWYGEPVVEVVTVPKNANVDLFYVRSNFQKRFEQTEAPVSVRLPSRIEATSRDSLGVRVMADGYATTHDVYRVHDVPERVVVRLRPLPNALMALDASYLEGRTTLTLRTKNQPEFRVSRVPGQGRVTLALHETANKLDRKPRIDSANVGGVELMQVGEDLLVHLELSDPELELRSRQRQDPARGEFLFTLVLQAADYRPPTLASIRSRVHAAMRRPDCDLAFERALLDTLEAGPRPRALAPGSAAEAYARETVRVLGQSRRGRVETRTGDVFRTGSDVELAMALESGRDVVGFVGLAAAVARDGDRPQELLRAVVAPDLDATPFSDAYAVGDAAYRACAR